MSASGHQARRHVRTIVGCSGGMTDDGARSRWAQSPAEEARARAQAALEECEDAPRGGPTVQRARAYPVHIVVLRALVERRSAGWQVRPARAGRLRRSGDESPRKVPPLDPWAVEIHGTLAWRATRTEVALAERASAGPCGPCGASGAEPCMFCAVAASKETCANCGGSGESPCRRCEGSGRVLATPAVIVEFEIVTSSCVVEAAALPRDLARAIENLELAGPVIFSERGPSLAPGSASEKGPYRGEDHLRVSGRVDAVIDVMLTREVVGSEPSVRARVHEREVEVRAVVLYVAALDNARTAYVCGSPAQVLPKGVCDTRPGLMGRLRRLLGGQRR